MKSKKHKHCWHRTVFEEQVLNSKSCGLINIWKWLDKVNGRWLCCKCGKPLTVKDLKMFNSKQILAWNKWRTQKGKGK